MAITIDWATKVVTIPRTDMTLVQSNPIEVRELSLINFHLTLRDLEDDEPGIVNLTTHDFVEAFTISGIQLAPIVAIINGYTVTFEDGQYAVNLVGANTNLQDQVNINQVSVRPTNSAGLVQTAEIQYSAYNNGVSYRADSGNSGIAYPIGTPGTPVDNLTDALAIQALRGLPKVLYVSGVFDLGTDTITGWDLIGESSWTAHCHNFSGGTVTDCELHSLHVSGTFTGNTIMRSCRVFNVSEFAGELSECILDGGTIAMAAGATGHLIDCRSGVVGAGTSTIDCNGDGQVGVRGYMGGLTIINKTSGEISIDMSSGHIQWDATNTGGTAVVRGIGKQTDNSNGIVIDDDGLISTKELQQGSYQNRVYIDTTALTTGTEYPFGTRQMPVTNLVDAQAICVARGFNHLRVLGDYNFLGGDDLRDYIVEGDGATMNVFNSIFTLDTVGTVSTSNCEFRHAAMRGKQAGETLYTDCVIDGIENAHCKYVRCCFVQPRTADLVDFTVQHGSFAGNTHTTELHDCYSNQGVAVIDRNGAKMNQRYVDFSGNLKFINQNHATESGSVFLHMIGGSVEIDSSCTEGEIRITGDCEIINNTGGTNVVTGIFQQLSDIKYAVESQRTTHQAYGQIFYVDPLLGADTNNGLSDISALATITQAHALCSDGANDIIQVINPSSAGHVHNETVVITKNNVHIRATSRDITFKAGLDGEVPFTFGAADGTNGYSCSFSGALVDGDKNGAITAPNCVVVNGKFCLLDALWLKQSTASCLLIRGGDYHVIKDAEYEKAITHGVETLDAGLASGSPREISVIGRTNIYLNAGNGIHLGDNGAGPVGSSTRIIRVLEGNLSDNGGYGLFADEFVDGVLVGRDVVIHDNPSGDISDTFNHVHYMVEHDQEKITEVHEVLGLDSANPVTHTDTGITSTNITQTITGPDSAKTVARS